MNTDKLEVVHCVKVCVFYMTSLYITNAVKKWCAACINCNPYLYIGFLLAYLNKTWHHCELSIETFTKKTIMYLSSRNVSSKMHCIHYKNTKAFCSCFDENYCAPTVAYIHNSAVALQPAIQRPLFSIFEIGHMLSIKYISRHSIKKNRQIWPSERAATFLLSNNHGDL